MRTPGAGLTAAAMCLLVGCSFEPRMCTTAGITDSLYVDVRSVELPVASVRVCLPDDCFGPAKVVGGRAFPLPQGVGDVGHLPSKPFTVAVETLDADGRPLAQAEGRISETVTSRNVDEDGDRCGPVGRAARVRLGDDGRSLQQVPLEAA